MTTELTDTTGLRRCGRPLYFRPENAGLARDGAPRQHDLGNRHAGGDRLGAARPGHRRLHLHRGRHGSGWRHRRHRGTRGRHDGSMPEMVALFNGLGGAASLLLVGWAALSAGFAAIVHAGDDRAVDPDRRRDPHGLAGRLRQAFRDHR